MEPVLDRLDETLYSMARHPLYNKLIHSNKWRKLRERVLKDNPLCVKCESEGRITLAEQVHHIIPVESAATDRRITQLMFSYSNLQGLCAPCHVLIHKELKSKSSENIKANQRRQTERFAEKFIK